MTANFCAKILVLAIGILGLAACSEMPTTGPTTAALHYQAVNSGDFYLVDITPTVAKVLASVPAKTLADEFGNSRPAPIQLIGTGDVVQISIWEASSGGLFANGERPIGTTTQAGAHYITVANQTVDASGSISIPFAGSVKIGGKTPMRAARAIEDALTSNSIHPQAVVTIVSNNNNFITVAGDAARPGRYPIDLNGTRLLDAIAMAGGSALPSYDMAIRLTRKRESIKIRLSSVFGNPRQNIYLENRDLIELIRDPMSVTVLGAVTKNSHIMFLTEKPTLAEIIGQAGGLVDVQADPGGVFILREEPNKVLRQIAVGPADKLPTSAPVIYQFNLKQAESLILSQTFQMHDKDVVYISTSESVQLGKIVRLLRDMAISIGAIQKGSTIFTD
jgi:polysaccharide biosynthesis/export protein